MRDMFQICEIKNETEKSADLYFYGDIVSSWWDAWQDEDQYPDSIKNFLNAQEGKDLNVYINSGGGSVFAGVAIYNMLKRHAQKNRVQVYVDGLAASIASVIAFAGSEPLIMPGNAFLMIHNPWAYCTGNAEDMRKMADDLDKIRVALTAIYKDHLKEGVTIEQIEQMMDAETWLSGEEAAEYFDISVAEAVQAAAAADGRYLAKARNVPKSLTFADMEKQRREDAEKRDKVKRAALAGL